MTISWVDAATIADQGVAEMPKNPRFPPPPLRVEILAFERVQLLDVAGPLQVFASANDLLEASGKPPPYEPVVVAERPLVTASAGLGLATQPLSRGNRRVDTLVVAGGWGVHPACQNRALVTWIKVRARAARRVASVCSGAFLLATA